MNNGKILRLRAEDIAVLLFAKQSHQWLNAVKALIPNNCCKQALFTGGTEFGVTAVKSKRWVANSDYPSFDKSNYFY